MKVILFLNKKAFQKSIFKVRTFFGVLIYLYLFWGMTQSISSNNLLLQSYIKTMEFNNISLVMIVSAFFLTMEIMLLLTGFDKPLWSLSSADMQHLVPAPIPVHDKYIYGVYQKNKNFFKLYLMFLLPSCFCAAQLSNSSLSSCFLTAFLEFVGLIQFYLFCVILQLQKRKRLYYFVNIIAILGSVLSIISYINIGNSLLALSIPFVGILINSGIYLLDFCYTANIAALVLGCLLLAVDFGLFVLMVKKYHSIEMDDSIFSISIAKVTAKIGRENQLSATKLNGAISIFLKQKCEIKNRNKKVYIDYKLLLLTLLACVFCVGLSQTKDANGEMISPQFLIILTTLLSAILCSYIAPESGYQESERTIFKLLPYSTSTKVFFAYLITFIRSSILGAITLSVLCFVLNFNVIIGFVSWILFLTFVLSISGSSYLYSVFFSKLPSESLVAIYLQTFLGLVSVIPGIIVCFVVYSFSSQLLISELIASVANGVFFVIMTEPLK